MFFSCDRTGFPLIGIPSLALEIQLWPVLKPQYERFLAETGNGSDRYYEMLLEYNHRISITRSTPANREGVFITGVLPEEVRLFAEWIGEGFRPPTVLEWRSVYTVMAKVELTMDLLKKVWQSTTQILPRSFLKQMESFTTNHRMHEMTLMSGGVVEWVIGEDKWLGLGAPRTTFYPHCYDPLFDCFELIDNTRRERCFGFRLVRAMR